MSNFICPTCGFTNIDCDHEGYKTPRELELEESLKKVNELDSRELIKFRKQIKLQEKEIEKLKTLLKECEPYINDSVDVQMSVGHYPQLEYDLLTRIKNVFGKEE